MSKSKPQLLVGLLLIIGGILFLLQSIGILPEGTLLFWTLAFATSGGIFLYVFAANRENWWALIPAAAPFAVAVAIGAGALLPVNDSQRCSSAPRCSSSGRCCSSWGASCSSSARCAGSGDFAGEEGVRR